MAERATVTAAELVRSFAQSRDAANRAPLFISNHGRSTHVLIGLDHYEALERAAAPRIGSQASGPEGVANDDVIELADWLDEAVIVCDAHLTVRFANRVAHAISRRPSRSLEGRNLLAALPELMGSLFEVQARRTMVSREPSAADLPSPFSRGAWIHLQSFPLASGNVLMFRDISEDVERHRLADVKEAILNAIELHADIFYVRLSVRGTIERIDDSFCTFLGLPEERLLGVPLVDLVALDQRSALRAQLDEVLRGGGSRIVESKLVSNRGTTEPASISMVQLQGAYGCEGAVMMIRAGQGEF